MIETLKDLDFTPGIRASDINYNFQLIHQWLLNERKRVGGWGIVEGFDITVDPTNMKIHVEPGILINQKGEEVKVPEKDIFCSDIGYAYNAVDAIPYKVNSSGNITLNDEVYDRYHRKYVNMLNGELEIPEDILDVRDLSRNSIKTKSVQGRLLTIDLKYAGFTVNVKQMIGYNRIDGIFLEESGEYSQFQDNNEVVKYVKESIQSDSPSHVNLDDYKDKYCVGIIYWYITDEGIKGEVFTNHRAYRQVYVDPDNNDLWVKQEIYKVPKFIYFSEPNIEDRQPNDLWYNRKDNTLYIWSYNHGEYGWKIVNDHSEIIIRRKKIWKPEDNPEDLSTFKFADDLDMHFIPGNNELTILVDCAPLMDDMYTEIVSSEEETAEYKQRISDIENEISQGNEDLVELINERDSLQATLRELKAASNANAELYPLNYSSETAIYQVTDADMPNLRQLVQNDLDIATKLDQLASVLTDIYELQQHLEDLDIELTGLKDIMRGALMATGVGFRLKRPLTHPAYVEAIVTHSVRSKSALETFQRAAIFVEEGDFVIATAGSQQLFKTNSVYSIGDEQLEVFVDGRKLSKGSTRSDQSSEGSADFCEVVDYTDIDTDSDYLNYDYTSSDHRNTYYGESSRHFRVLGSLAVGQKVSYRLSRHVWSYAQLDKVISGIKKSADQAYQLAKDAKNLSDNFQQALSDAEQSLTDTINRFKEEIGTLSDYYKKGMTINFNDLDSTAKNNVMGDPIDLLIPVRSSGSSDYILPGISVTTDTGIVGGDYLNVSYINYNYIPAETRVLVGTATGRDSQEVDYSLRPSGSDTVLSLINTDLQEDGAKLYITGFKRGR